MPDDLKCIPDICINAEINDNTVNDYYHLDKNYRGSHHLVSGPESDDPEVVEKQILGILKIVTTDGIQFVPGAQSRRILLNVFFFLFFPFLADRFGTVAIWRHARVFC